MYYRAVSNINFFIAVFFGTVFSAIITQEAGAEGGEDWESIPDDKTVQYLNEQLSNRVEESGYKLGIYQVLTKDDYILKVHRLINNGKSQKPPVLLMHGLTGCSAIFLVLKKGVGFYLANKGYDVWIANARGNTFSMKHRFLKPNKSIFWDFSFHEMGYYDLPAIIDKILDKTGASRVHYVGFSMGTTMFLVMASSHNNIAQDKIASVTLVAPVANPRNFHSIRTKPLRILHAAGLNILKFFGRGDYKSYNKFISWAKYTACKSILTKWLCKIYYRKLSEGKGIFDLDSYIEVLPFIPAGASIKTFLHFIQLAGSEKFQQYDYGEKKNQLIHKQESPPVYNLGSIKNKLYMLVGGEDNQATIKDVKWLYNQLNSRVYIGKRFKDYGHMDFLFNTQPMVVNETILEIIESHEQKRDPKGIEDEETLN